MTTRRPGHWKERHALGLPGGSVRALLALAVLGTIWALLWLQPDVLLPYYLQNLMFIVLGHYYAVRGAAARDEGEPAPLYLWKGAVRFLLLAGFVGVGVLLYRQGRLAGSKPTQAALVLILVGAFLLGVLLARVLLWWQERGHRTPRLFEDLRAVLGLAAAGLLVCLVFDVEPFTEKGALGFFYRFVSRERSADILAAVVGFYFGSRS